jgi:Xaa-Pro aminopeptidase
MTTISSRLKSLRSAMQIHKVDALIIPSSDPHQSEYVCDHWKSRVYFSGFTGSSGYLVVLKDYAALFTDSRYFLQAEEELKNNEVVLHKQSIPHSPEHVAWLSIKLPEHAKIGIEGLLFSLSQVDHMQSEFSKNEQFLINVDGIVSEVWKNRPAMPTSRVYEHKLHFTGKSRQDKLSDLRNELSKNKADHYFASSLDEIAWLLNIRAWDIEFTPVALAYLLVKKNESYLYINKDRVDDKLIETLSNQGIVISPYEKALEDLHSIAQEEILFIDKESISWTFDKQIKAKKMLGSSLINPMQAIKNSTEIEHIKNAMIKDGVALTQFFIWLEESIGKEELSESDLVKKIAYFRSKQADYVGESFSAIVGFKGNGAIVHYNPDEESSARIKGTGMLLIDSGGQYLDGTTDITRTIYLGEPEKEHKRDFTLVLKGNIALQSIQFPEGTSGMQLDTLARMYLWNEGLNYGHGTGHGVGFFLRVHEPPQGFASSATTSRGSSAHQPGMFSSNEPGFYKKGAYGIRIENLMICKEAQKNDYGNFLNFEALTLFPISTKLIQESMLDTKEKEWLNSYHAEVLEKLTPHLNEKESKWLKKACKAI